MITRVVKMHFREALCEDFEKLFRSRRAGIEAMPGCHSVTLHRDSRDPGVYFTISLWEDEASLDQYRASGFFKETWAATKALFAAKAEAWSLTTIP